MSFHGYIVTGIWDSTESKKITLSLSLIEERSLLDEIVDIEFVHCSGKCK